MAMDENFISISGTVVADPEQSSPSAPVKLRMVHNRRYRPAGTEEWVSDATFVTVLFWGNDRDDAMGIFEKGGRIQVTGRLEENVWEDKETGKKRSMLQIIARSFSVPLAYSASPGPPKPKPESNPDEDFDF